MEKQAEMYTVAWLEYLNAISILVHLYSDKGIFHYNIKMNTRRQVKFPSFPTKMSTFELVT